MPLHPLLASPGSPGVIRVRALRAYGSINQHCSLTLASGPAGLPSRLSPNVIRQPLRTKEPTPTSFRSPLPTNIFLHLPSTPTRLYSVARDAVTQLSSGPSASLSSEGTTNVQDNLDKESGGSNVFPSTSNQPKVLGRKKQRARRPSPSKRILEGISAIQPIEYGFFKGHRKPDYSYVNPNPRRRKRKAGSFVYNGPTSSEADIRLSIILARFLEYQGPRRRHDQFTLSYREQYELHSKGYSLCDLEDWAHLLLEPHSARAIHLFSSKLKVPPLSVLLLFLRRDHLNVVALRDVLTLVDQYSLSWRSPEQPPADMLDWARLKLLVIRLLRHARKSLPEAIPHVVTLFLTHVTNLSADKAAHAKSAPSLFDLTFFCNRFLSLLALPTNLYPILSSAHQEKAQFQLLRFMADHKPSLIITANGFRGIALLQLLRPKTSRERVWAQLKSPSWPPWKEDRTAMDEDKGTEYGMSRAAQIVRRMYEAGYPGDAREDVVGIYSGWDTDRSPTIQIRDVFRPLINSRGTHLKEGSRLSLILTWAARVRATRTRREAWACFLAYERSGLRAHQEVYLAMFEKLHYPVVQPSQLQKGNDHDGWFTPDVLLPGDAKEVFPEPVSSQDNVYIPEPVPTLEALYERMSAKSVRPTERCLALLVRSTGNAKTAVRLWRSAEDSYGGAVRHLLNMTVDDLSVLEQLPPYLFAEFLRFLCRYSSLTYSESMPFWMDPGSDSPENSSNSDSALPVTYAYRLLVEAKPRYRPSWTILMEAFIPLPSTSPNMDFEPKARNAASVFRKLQELVSLMRDIDMEPDARQFQLLCRASESATRACLLKARESSEARMIISTSPMYLRSQFHSLTLSKVDGDSRSARLPLECVPPPAVCHAYVRALGVLRDYEGIYSFAAWMESSNSALMARAEGQRGGKVALRKTVIAIRAFLEWDIDGVRPGVAAPRELVELVKRKIEGLLELGDWPTDHEVELYKQTGLEAMDNGSRSAER